MSKESERKSQRKWREKHPGYEKGRKAYKKEWFQKNKGKVLTQQEGYRKKNAAKVAAYRHRYYEKNKDKIYKCQEAWRKRNREKVASYSKKYYQKNKERIKKRRDIRKGRRDLNREGKSG